MSKPTVDEMAAWGLAAVAGRGEAEDLGRGLPPRGKSLPDAQIIQAWSAMITRPVAVVGVGNEMRQDDAAGLHVARLVGALLSCHVVIAEDVPESYLGPIVQSRPKTVIFCDAVDLRQAAGAVALLEADALAGAVVSTHNPSLRLLARCLRAEGVERVLVAAVQPLRVGWGQGLTEPARAGARRLARLLAAAIDKARC